MKRLLSILIIGVMLFSIGMVAFASPRTEGCSQGGQCEGEMVDGAHNMWYIMCRKCGTILDYGYYD